MKRDLKVSSLQTLRAIAALSVVVYHADLMWRTSLVPGASLQWANGAAGVDIFFVISGVVMVLSASRLAGMPRPGRLFLWARLRRIVPLYWLCTLAKIAGLALTGHAGRLGLYYCVASLFFLPVHDAAGFFQPILPVGWTLSFEMLFYALFAVSLGAKISPCLCVPPVLLAIAWLPRSNGAWSELSNPILLEFAYGMAIAVVWQRWRLNATWAGLPLLLAGSAFLLFLPRDFLASRCLSWGLPAAAMVAGIMLLDAILAPRLPRLLCAFGDASYAIYLTHGFVLAALPFILHGTRLGSSAVATLFCAALASAAFGWLTHRFVERWLSGKLPARTRSPPMVLVLVGGGFAPLSGGVGVLLRNLIDAWAHMPEAPRVQMLDTRGAGGKLAGTLRFAWALLQVIRLCGSRRAHLVHAHMTTRGSTLRKSLLSSVAITLRVPVVMHMHGADFMPFYRGLPFPLKIPLGAVLRRTAHVVVLGAAWRAFLIEEIGVMPGRITILANGVPQPPPAVSLVLPGTPRLLFLGRLCERKGLPELIAALGTPALRKRDWQAVIAGDGDPAPFRAMIGWHRLGARAHMPGWLSRTETAALLAHADILVLPSHHEAMPIAILEALAAGIAVITTPVGTIPEFLQHNVNALLVAPGDVAGLAAAIQQLLDNPTLRVRLAAAGHEVFREKLEIGGVAARLATLYRTSLATPAWSHSEAAE
jgi:peptidoglycan/LPS O-acetylase OafA/YrhL/glycosyltransferase involved in cell wall biosynthesis